MNVEAAPVSTRSAWISLGALIILYLLSIFDRLIMSLLMIPLQADLLLTDLELGALTGLAFSIFYASAGLILGWASDLYSKKVILFCGVLIWSVATALSGLAESFSGLFIARLAVGFGEAAVGPIAFSVLTSIFPRQRISMVLGIYSGAANIGMAMAFIGGGLVIAALESSGGLSFPIVGHLKPWQSTFVLIGLPGLLIAFLAFAVAEPPQSASHRPDEDRSLARLLRFFGENRRTVLLHLAANGAVTMSCYSSMAWAPTYLGRTYDWDPATIGLVIGVSTGGAGLVGNIIWGAIADGFVKRGRREGVYIAYSLAVLIGAPLAVATFMIHSPVWVVVGLCLSWMTIFSVGGMNSAIGMFTPLPLRGRVSAVAFLTQAVFGVALVPVLIGGVTDYVFHDQSMVGASMACVIAGASILAIGLMYLVRKPFCESVQRAEAQVT